MYITHVFAIDDRVTPGDNIIYSYRQQHFSWQHILLNNKKDQEKRTLTTPN